MSFKLVNLHHIQELQVHTFPFCDLFCALSHRYGYGLVEALRLVAEPQVSEEVPAAVKVIAACMLNVISGINYVQSLFRPHIRVRFSV